MFNLMYFFRLTNVQSNHIGIEGTTFVTTWTLLEKKTLCRSTHFEPILMSIFAYFITLTLKKLMSLVYIVVVDMGTFDPFDNYIGILGQKPLLQC